MRSLLSVLIILHSQFAFCQLITTTNGKKELTMEMVMQVKQLSQFLERFNYEKDFNNKPIDSLFRKEMDRKSYIRLLFNDIDKKTDTTISGSKIFNQKLGKFTTQVTNQKSPVYLHRESELLFAVAECEVVYNKKKETLFLTLQNSVAPNGGLKWQIVAAIADFLRLKPATDNRMVTIPPNSQETNFLSMQEIFNHKKGFEEIIPSKKDYHDLSAFLFGIQEGFIGFNYVRNIAFHVLETEGWIMVIRNFNRNTLSSGWLIDELIEANQEQKNLYLNQKLYFN